MLVAHAFLEGYGGLEPSQLTYQPKETTESNGPRRLQIGCSSRPPTLRQPPTRSRRHVELLRRVTSTAVERRLSRSRRFGAVLRGIVATSVERRLRSRRCAAPLLRGIVATTIERRLRRPRCRVLRGIAATSAEVQLRRRSCVTLRGSVVLRQSPFHSMTSRRSHSIAKLWWFAVGLGATVDVVNSILFADPWAVR